ncbi:T9SS type A sorting domain-containing protein [bacterium]|nr:T9SS type A sorting domain-containing protein [bacterium]
MKKMIIILFSITLGYLYSDDIYLTVNEPTAQYNDSNFRTISEAVHHASENYNDTLYTVKIQIFQNPEINNDPVYENGAYRENIITSGLCGYEFYSGEQESIIIYPFVHINPVISLRGGGSNNMIIRDIRFHNDTQNFIEYGDNVAIYVKSPNVIIKNCQFMTGLYRNPFNHDIKLEHDNDSEAYEKALYVNDCLFDTSMESYINVSQIGLPRILCSLIGDKYYETTYTFYGSNNQFIRTGPAAYSSGARNIYWNNNYSKLGYCNPLTATFLFTNCDYGNGIICKDNTSEVGGYEIVTSPRRVSFFEGNIFHGFRFDINYPTSGLVTTSKFVNNVIVTSEDGRFVNFLFTTVHQDTISNNNFLNEVNPQGIRHQNLTIAGVAQTHNNIFSNYEFEPIHFFYPYHIVSNMFNNCYNSYDHDLNITGEPIFEDINALDFSLVWPSPAIGNGYSDVFDSPEPGLDMKLLTYQDDTIDIGAIPFNEDRKQYHRFEGGTTTKNWTGFPALDPENETTIFYDGINQTLPNNNMIVMFQDFTDYQGNYASVGYKDWDVDDYVDFSFVWGNYTTQPTLVQPYLGYKITAQNDIDHWFGGLLQDPDMDIPLPATPNEIWLGYHVPYTTDVLVAFNDILGSLQTIKHKDWAMYWNGTKWTGKTTTGNTNLELGDFVAITYRSSAEPPSSFNWTYYSYSNPNSFKYQDASYVSYEEKNDYTSFFVDIDENSNIEEIALYANDECIGGAKTQGEATVMVKAFMEDVPEDSEISIIAFTGAKTSKKVKHLAEYNSNLQVWNNTDNIIKDSRIYYHVSLTKDNTSIIETNQIITTNYPNPFNPETTIEFNNPVQGQVSVNIYNLKGQLVKSLLQDNLNQGVHKVIWRGNDSNDQQVASGVYFYKISSGNNKSVTKKIILMK